LVLGALREPPGYAHPLVEHGLMGASMSAPMVAWMRHRGHSWSDGMEMTAAMLVPAFVLVFAAEWGPASSVFSLSGSTPTMLSHLTMVAGMAALMVYRWDRYAHRAHGRSA
jgi:flagellar biosynthetic protein FliP